MDRSELDRALLAAGCYPGAVGPVELIETHLSRLYFVDLRVDARAVQRVFKVKKAVDLGFVDFSTLEKRRQACEDEVRLNRRMAPAVYHGVVPIVRDAAGRFRVGDAVEVASVVEYAVEMERLPAACLLDAKLERGEIDRGVIVRLATTLADFHGRARRGPDVDAFATPDAIAQRVAENLDGAMRAGDVPKPLAGFLRDAFARFVRERRALLERRVAQGRICEGHGDLHAGNLCLLSDAVVAFDCIEFSRALRCLDVAADLAFLLMDLDRLGFPAFGLDIVRLYQERTADPELHTLLPFYKAHLAIVRGKVALLRGAADSGLEALRYFALATRYALPPVLFVTCGLPGSGKTFVAHALARALDAQHLQADFERKRMSGLPPDVPVPAEQREAVYSTATTERTYARLHDLARAELERGRSAILDATFARADWRARALALAREHHVPFVLLQCRAEESLARRRLTERAGERGQFSDADVAVFEQARGRFEPPDEIPSALQVAIESPCVAETMVVAAIGCALAQPHGASPRW